MNPIPQTPWHPEALDQIKARLPLALAEVKDFSTPAAGKQRLLEGLQNGVPAKNIFDFEDGIRMIVTREQIGQLGIFTHLSFGGHNHGPHPWPYWDEFKLPLRAAELVLELSDKLNLQDFDPAAHRWQNQHLHLSFIERKL